MTREKDDYFKVSELGSMFIKCDYNTKLRLFVKQLTQRPIFRVMIEVWIATMHLFEKNIVDDLIRLQRPDIGGSTVSRRASSVNLLMN